MFALPRVGDKISSLPHTVLFDEFKGYRVLDLWTVVTPTHLHKAV